MAANPFMAQQQSNQFGAGIFCHICSHFICLLGAFGQMNQTQPNPMASQFGAAPMANQGAPQQQWGGANQMSQLGGAFGQLGLGVAPAAAPQQQQQVNPFADLGSFEKKQPAQQQANSLNVDLWGWFNFAIFRKTLLFNLEADSDFQRASQKSLAFILCNNISSCNYIEHIHTQW